MKANVMLVDPENFPDVVILSDVEGVVRDYTHSRSVPKSTMTKVCGLGSDGTFYISHEGRHIQVPAHVVAFQAMLPPGNDGATLIKETQQNIVNTIQNQGSFVGCNPKKFKGWTVQLVELTDIAHLAAATGRQQVAVSN